MAMDQESASPQEVATEEVSTDRWPEFARDLSRTYVGWRVWIEVLGMDAGDQPLVEGLPLQGVSFDPAGSAAGNILIEAGDRPDLFIHQVVRPRAIRVAHMRPGELMFMQLECAEGGVTLVRFQRMLELPAGRSGRRERSIGSRRERVRDGARIGVKGRTVGAGALVALAGIGALLLLRHGARRRPARRAYLR